VPAGDVAGWVAGQGDGGNAVALGWCACCRPPSDQWPLQPKHTDGRCAAVLAAGPLWGRGGRL